MLQRYIQKSIVPLVGGILVAEIVDIFRKKPKVKEKVLSSDISTSFGLVTDELRTYNQNLAQQVYDYLSSATKDVEPKVYAKQKKQEITSFINTMLDKLPSIKGSQRKMNKLKSDIGKLREDSEKIIDQIEEISTSATS